MDVINVPAGETAGHLHMKSCGTPFSIRSVPNQALLNNTDDTISSAYKSRSRTENTFHLALFF